MHGDFARLTFNPTKHYTGVLHQQGRVWLEADWNEDVYNRQNLLWQETFDIIGACGVPDPGTAFQINPNPNPASAPFDFLIAGGPGSEGRYYVDGILAQLEHTISYLQQPDFPNAPSIQMPNSSEELRALVYLEVWQRLITYLEDEPLREIALGGPDTATRLKTIAQVKVLPATSDQDLTCATAELPGPSNGRLTTIQPKDSQPDELCSLPDPSSYTGRENHLYRVEIHEGGDVIGSDIGFAFNERLAQDASMGAVTLTLQDVLSQGQLGALKRSGVVSLVDDDGQTEIVAVTDVSTDTSATHLALGRGLSRSYTVAKNAAVIGGVARFKWSRDNASFAVRVTTVSSDRLTLTLSSLGRDQATALRDLDLVEISDDASDLGPARGHLTYLTADPDPDQFTVNLADPLPDIFSVDRHLVLRRWDGWGWTNAHFDAAATPDMDFGDGVHIHFGGWDLRSGDFWQFAARIADGSVEALTDAPPFGIIRHTCPLAIVNWNFQVLFDDKTIINLAKEIPLTDDQIKQLEQKLKNSGKSLWNASEVEALIRSVGATPDQLSKLDRLLASLSKEMHPRLTFTVLEDCRQPFDPLTKQHPCDCTVTVAPGESLSAAFDKINDPGGIVCLLPGVHELADTVTVVAKKGLTIRGAGAATIINAPTVMVALNFQNCVNLTLRDFIIASWQQISIQKQPGTPVGSQPTGSASPTSTGPIVPESGSGPVEGVVTFTDCQAVHVIDCIVANATFPHGGTRACISFLSSTLKAGSDSLRRVQLLTQLRPSRSDILEALHAPSPLSGKESATGGPTPLQILTGRPDDAGAAPGLSSLIARVGEFAENLDFTLRDCRLYADTGQYGLIVANSIGVFIEDNWFLPLADLDSTGFNTLPESIPQNQRGVLALAFSECRAVMVTHNVVLGFDSCLAAEGVYLWLRDNICDECGDGFNIFFNESLLLSGNVLRTDTGPAVVVNSGNGEANLAGNVLFRLPLPPEFPQTPPQTVSITADTVTLSNNEFRNSMPLDSSVKVTANRITYTSNYSFCNNVPTIADVILLGQTNPGGQLTGSISAVSNTCLEPPPKEVTDFESSLQDFRKQQAGLTTALMTTQDPAQRQQLLQQFSALDKEQQDFVQRLKALTFAGGEPISLFASAAFVVTGMNLLSNGLVHLGIGSDQSSVEGVS